DPSLAPPLPKLSAAPSELSVLEHSSYSLYYQPLVQSLGVGLNTKFALAAHNICFEAPDENVGMDFLKHTEIRLNENG
ncbi:MAG: hypothetical protein EZS28_049538, partial [Streblomastix strix]